VTIQAGNRVRYTGSVAYLNDKIAMARRSTNNVILLGAGNDVVTNRVGALVILNPLTGTRNDINAVTNMVVGADQFFMLGGRDNNLVLLGPDNDVSRTGLPLTTVGTLRLRAREGRGEA
jgi:hypothetical protein